MCVKCQRAKTEAKYTGDWNLHDWKMTSRTRANVYTASDEKLVYDM